MYTRLPNHKAAVDSSAVRRRWNVWLGGGWAVETALGEQTRSHKDVDIIVRISDLPQNPSAEFAIGLKASSRSTPQLNSQLRSKN